jgi:selenide,water dikinase
LAQVLRPLVNQIKAADFPNLLVGLGEPDDAAVYRITDERAIIQTMDFFPPVVDDAYLFGAIAAANAMSDIYAMGGEVILGLNIAAWRDDLPLELLADIFRGGADKMLEGGGVIAGGHTITDKEPKYGIAVTGIAHPDHIFTKGGAHIGDALLLTKPLGTGILTTAGKNGTVAPNHLDIAIQWMVKLNRGAMHAARAVGLKSATDITGYSLLGHAYEMASASGVRFQIVKSRLPVLDGALDLARMDQIPGGTSRNRDYLRGKVFLPKDLTDDWDALLFDPQTSGGLLFAVPPAQLAQFEAELASRNVEYWQIGQVISGDGVEVIKP